MSSPVQGAGARVPRTVRLLVCCDIFGDIEKVEGLLSYMLKECASIDVHWVLVLGNIANLHGDHRNKLEEKLSCEGDVTWLLTTLENIHAHLLYIPGNHDPDSLAQLQSPRPRLTPSSKNIHNRALRLEDGLVAVGFGGGRASCFMEEGDCHVNGIEDEDIADHLEDLLDSASDLSNLHVPQSIICVTSVGPSDCETTADPTNENAGSKALAKALEASVAKNEKIVLHIHGNTPTMAREGTCKGIAVLNPGSLRKGEFCIVELQDDPSTNEWAVSSVVHHQLP